MTQIIEGTHTTKLAGIPVLLFVSKTVLRSNKDNSASAVIYSLHIGPLALSLQFLES